MFKLPDLPYAYDALQPTISAETMRLHHDKHHAKYVETTNKLVEAEGLKPASLEDLVVQAKSAGKAKLHDNAAQAWNHAFFWACMSPARTDPAGALAQGVDRAFGGLEKLKTRFVETGAGHFGSGWVWLLAGPDGLQVAATHDGANHLDKPELVPLLVCDLWEHAYYVDYRNDREAYLEPARLDLRRPPARRRPRQRRPPLALSRPGGDEQRRLA